MELSRWVKKNSLRVDMSLHSGHVILIRNKQSLLLNLVCLIEKQQILAHTFFV